jgi:magnesium chelatase family protein
MHLIRIVAASVRLNQFNVIKSISGPLLDRIDLHIDVPPLQANELQNNVPVEDSMTVRKRVMSAYDSQIQRQQKANFALSPQELEQYAVLDAHAEK